MTFSDLEDRISNCFWCQCYSTYCRWRRSSK